MPWHVDFHPALNSIHSYTVLVAPMADSKCASILAIGTANPPNVVHQDDFVDEYFRLTGCEHEEDLKSKMKEISSKTGVQKRHFGHIFKNIHQGKTSNVLAENYPSINERVNKAMVDISKLGAKAALVAIEEWGQPVSRITHLVVHATSGLKMPGIDFQLVKLLGLKPCVRRCMLYHYGCMAGGTTLRIAKDMAENNSGARVLVVCSEVVLEALHEPSDTTLFVPALFGEGAAALIVGTNPDMSTERPLFQMVSGSQTIIPETESFVATEIHERGMDLLLSSTRVLGKAIANSIESFVIEAVGKISIIKTHDWNQFFWIVHPGAPRIMEALETKLNLNQEKLKDSRIVLREYGNMWSPTSLFVMNEVRKCSIAEGLATTGKGFEWGIFIGIGPGMTLELILLRSFSTGKE